MPHKPEDIDGSQRAYHHSLGPRRNQATPGTHRHKVGDIKDGYDSVPLFEGQAPVNIDELMEVLELYGLDISAFTGEGGAVGTLHHGDLNGLSDDDHPQYLRIAELLEGSNITITNNGDGTVTIASTGGGGLQERDTYYFDTTSQSYLDEQINDSIVPCAGFRMFRVECDTAMRVRLYSTNAHAVADQSRPIGTDIDISEDHGLLFEFVCDAAIDYDLSPAVDLHVYDETSLIIYATIQNLELTDEVNTMTYHYVRTE